MKSDVEISDALKHPEQYIPNGIYCHTHDHLHLCPFWDRDDEMDYMESGYCHYLKMGDHDFYEQHGYMSLLWDMCKECGVNEDDDDWGINEVS